MLLDVSCDSETPRRPELVPAALRFVVKSVHESCGDASGEPYVGQGVAHDARG